MEMHIYLFIYKLLLASIMAGLTIFYLFILFSLYLEFVTNKENSFTPVKAIQL